MKKILTQSLANSFLSTAAPAAEGYSKVYRFNRGSYAHGGINQICHLQNSAVSILEYFFSPIASQNGATGLMGKPLFTHTANKVVIHLFYYLPDTDSELNNSSINELGTVLTKLFKLNTELRLVRLHYPYLNSYILAQYIALNSKRYNYSRMQRVLFDRVPTILALPTSLPALSSTSNEEISTGKITTLASHASHINKNAHSVLTSHLAGIKVQIAGRLATQKMIPRSTVQTGFVGSFAKDKRSSVDQAKYTSKNKIGAFTVKVWLSNKYS